MIFKRIEQLAAYMGGVQRTMHFDVFEGFVREAEEFFIIPAVGDGLLSELSGFVNAEDDDLGAASEKEKRLIDLLRMAVAGYVDYVGAYRMAAPVGDAGRVMPTPPNSQAITKWATVGTMETSLARGDMALEKAIVFLEWNADVFESWTSSEHYTVFKGCFVPTATAFTSHFPFAKNSRRLFLGFKAELKKYEGSFLDRIIGKGFNDVLKARLLADDLTTAEVDVFERIAAVVSLKAVVEGVTYLNINEHWRLVSNYDTVASEATLPDTRRNEISMQVGGALELAKNELIGYLQETATADVFAEYFESELYDARVKKPSRRFENKRERKYGVL